jgi:FlaA1/EpsC-like NDP-sugar epimerase
VLVALDAAIVAVSWGAAMVLRYDARVPERAWEAWWSFLPVAVLVTFLLNWVARLYSGVSRHAGIDEARRVLAAQGAAAVLVLPAVVLLERPVPLSVPLIAAVLAAGLMGATRFHSRLFAFPRAASSDTESIVVVGAGSAGVALARDVSLRSSRVRVVAFLDDDPALLGRRLQGVTVLGTVGDLREVASRWNVSYAVLAIPSASPALSRRVAVLAEGAGIVLRVVPPLAELVNGEVLLRNVRDIELRDLLGRGQIEHDLVDVVSLLQGKRVLVTGAGGSIGSEIARQVAPLAAAVILVDHDETHLFECAAGMPSTARQRLVDIREPDAVEQVFRQERPDIVFHAAAHKHVPLLEDHPVEAVQTNVFGTQTVVDTARRAGAQHFVLISTDKAVQPRSIMGATKFLGENIVLRESQAMTVCAVRFGNVLGSRGSVVPTFADQIRCGGPVTVTDPRMTRYFMSIPEAVRLVVHAAALAKGGEVFMLDMGEPVRIIDLAHRMVRLSGRRPGTDVEIRVTGVRPGEKFSENLHAAEESPRPTSHPSILRLRPRRMSDERLRAHLDQLALAVGARDDITARRLLTEAADTSTDGSAPAEAANVPRSRADEDAKEMAATWT